MHSVPITTKVVSWESHSWRGQWFSAGTLVSSTNKTDRHDTAEILLKVGLSTIKPVKLVVLFILLIEAMQFCHFLQMCIALAILYRGTFGVLGY